MDTNGASISEAFGSTNRYFQVQIGGSPPITPRQQVLTTPYAFQSTRAESAARVDNFVTTNTRTFYVSTNGSDVNTGLSFISAKRTIRSALDAIPFNILHEVQILVYPGTYTEWLVINKNPRCGYDSELGMLRSWLSIKGMGSIPDAVKIRNLDLFGSRLHMVNLTVEGGVGLNYNASADFNSCRFVGPAAAMALNFGSVAIIEDCIFDGPGTNTTAIFASERSQLILQDDHIRQNGSDDIPGSHR
ncbi:MAG: hypothetical protein IH623_22980 [Verrucomicrobia bacterium]|nr:hypothetical protein [Verrucomicrobiota bacterium]